jgi:hypothetical protein
LGGGKGRGEGGGALPWPPRKGEGGDEVPPPLRILTTTTKKSKFSHSFFFKIFKICVIYPYPLKVSLSVHCCCSKLHKHLWRRCPLNKKQNSFIHCGILKWWYEIYYISPPPKYYYYYYYFSKKKIFFSLSMPDDDDVMVKTYTKLSNSLSLSSKSV